MKPDEVFLAQPIRSLQTMLRVLAENDNRYGKIIPDGIYGSQTVSAVKRFQDQNGLPATGITDQKTWEALVEAYQVALVELSLPEPVQVLLDPGQVIQPGQQGSVVAFAQVMLGVLARNYHCLNTPEVTGILDMPTRQALRIFQGLCGLEATGTLDRHTWKHLALQYPMAEHQPINSGTRQVYPSRKDA